MPNIKEAAGAGHRVVVAHNHPGSSLQSALDIFSLHKSGASFGVIACHDGSIIRFEQVEEPIGGYDSIMDESVQILLDSFGIDIDGLIKSYRDRLGVRIECLV